MSTGHNSTSATPRQRYELSPEDLKEVTKVLDYVDKEKKDIQKVYKGFEKRGYFGLFIDSKVPEKDKKIFKLVSLKRSDQKDCLDKIKKYKEIYEEIDKAVVKVKNPEKRTDNEYKAPQNIVNDLKIKLKERAEAAELGLNSTSSSTVYNTHWSFISKYGNLENMIKGIQCIVVTEELNKAKDELNESKNELIKVQEEFKIAENKMEEKCSALERKYKKDILLLKEKQNDLLEENKIVYELLEKSIDTITKLKSAQEELKSAEIRMEEKHTKLIEEQNGKNHSMMQQNETLKQDLSKSIGTISDLKNTLESVQEESKRAEIRMEKKYDELTQRHTKLIEEQNKNNESMIILLEKLMEENVAIKARVRKYDPDFGKSP